MKFGHAVSEICERTDTETDRHTDTLIAICRGGQSKPERRGSDIIVTVSQWNVKIDKIDN